MERRVYPVRCWSTAITLQCVLGWQIVREIATEAVHDSKTKCPYRQRGSNTHTHTHLASNSIEINNASTGTPLPSALPCGGILPVFAVLVR